MNYKNGKIYLDEKNQYNNFMSINNTDYELIVLDPYNPTGKGSNSSVYKLVSDEENEDLVIKFCNSPCKEYDDSADDRIAMFKREVEALKIAEKKKINNIIKIFFVGCQKINNKYFMFYVMEYAKSDLKEYLKGKELTIQQKILICYDILQAVENLHNLNIYHRDIKPDNFLLVGDNWKIGDLGLIAFRGKDTEDIKYKKMIGPKGFMSPEATNRFYVNLENMSCEIDCQIDEKSDIFQLGKLFWYILQGDVPTGQLTAEDFKLDDKFFNNILIPMLQYSKARRSDINTLKKSFVPIRKDNGL